jgi:hypothetical protein
VSLSAWHIKTMALEGLFNKGIYMPTLSDSRRKGIQAKQRKALNALKRAAKVAKRQRNGTKKA